MLQASADTLYITVHCSGEFLGSSFRRWPTAVLFRYLRERETQKATSSNQRRYPKWLSDDGMARRQQQLNELLQRAYSESMALQNKKANRA